MTKEDLSKIGFDEHSMQPIEPTPAEREAKDSQENRRKNGYVAGMALLGKIRKDG